MVSTLCLQHLLVLKVISLNCIAHPCCAKFLATSARFWKLILWNLRKTSVMAIHGRVALMCKGLCKCLFHCRHPPIRWVYFWCSITQTVWPWSRFRNTLNLKRWVPSHLIWCYVLFVCLKIIRMKATNQYFPVVQGGWCFNFWVLHSPLHSYLFCFPLFCL